MTYIHIHMHTHTEAYETVDKLMERQNATTVIIEGETVVGQPKYQLQGITGTNYANLVSVGIIDADLLPLYGFSFGGKSIELYSCLLGPIATVGQIYNIIMMKIDDDNIVSIGFKVAEVDNSTKKSGTFGVYHNKKQIYELDNWCGNNNTIELLTKFLVHKDIVSLFCE